MPSTDPPRARPLRLAKVVHQGRDVVAIEHEGGLYAVDVLDTLLGGPLAHQEPVAHTGFDRRVFGLAWAGLAEHAGALAEGARAPEAKLAGGEPLLPPIANGACVRETLAVADTDLSTVLARRALLGEGGVGLFDAHDGALEVAPALVVVVGEDLHLPTPAEALRAVCGVTLGLAWSLSDDDLAGLGAGPGRDVGTHVGPLLVAAEGLAGVTHVEVELRAGGGRRVYRLPFERERVGRLLARAARFADVAAGDALLLTASPRLRVSAGDDVVARADAPLAALRGRMGGSPGRRNGP